MIYMYITYAYSTHELPNGALVISFFIIVVFTLTPPPPIVITFETGGGWVDDPPLFDRFAHFQIPEGLEIDLDDFIFNPDVDGILQMEPLLPPTIDNRADALSRGGPPLEWVDDTGAGRSVGNAPPVPPLERTLELIEDAAAGTAEGNASTNRFGYPPAVVNPSTGEINYLFQFGSDSDSDVTGSDPEITPEPPIFPLPWTPNPAQLLPEERAALLEGLEPGPAGGSDSE